MRGRGVTTDAYKANGYEDRSDYLKCLAEDHGVPLNNVLFMANVLGPGEDFDALVTAIQDGDLGEM